MTVITRALGLGAALAVALTGCGGSGGSTAPAPSVAASSAASSAAAGSATTAAAATVGSTVPGKDLAARLGTAMAATPNAAVKLTMSGEQAGGGTGTLTFAAGGSALKLTVPQADSADKPLTLIQTADAVYIDGETAGATGKQWVRITGVSEKDGLFSSLFGPVALGVASFVNPDGLMRVLAVTPGLTVKASDAQGVTYTATLPAKAIAEIFPAALFGGDAKAKADFISSSAGGTATLTVVTDPQGRPTTMTYVVAGDGKPETLGSAFTWGAGEPVTAPDPATVMEAKELDK